MAFWGHCAILPATATTLFRYMVLGKRLHVCRKSRTFSSWFSTSSQQAREGSLPENFEMRCSKQDRTRKVQSFTSS